MPPDGLIDLLARLVADGALTEAQAAGILRQWREIDGLDLLLPLPVAEGVATEERDREAFVIALAVSQDNYMRLLGVQDEAEAWRKLRRLGPRSRIASANRVQDIHAAEVRRLTEALLAGRIGVAEWQRQVRRQNVLAFDVLLALGASGPAPGLSGRLEETEREQAAYLQRFADGVAGNWLAALLPAALATTLGLVAQRWTEDYIAQRAASYSGAGRRLFFEAWETGGGGPGDGWVVQYVAQDDERTCSPCREAEGFYLPGDGPYPGEVCLGGGHCRCERWPIYSPGLYAQLVELGAAL